MTPAPTSLDRFRDLGLEDLLTDLGLDHRLLAVDLDLVDWDGTAASQIRGDGTDPEVVDRYAAALNRGEPIPAGFGIEQAGVTQALDRPTGPVTVVGGVHRAHAYRQAEAPAALPLYVLPGTVDRRIVRIAAIRHNARHGVPLSTADRCRLGLELSGTHDMTKAEAAAIVGISPTALRQAEAVELGGVRASQVGMTREWSALNVSIRYRVYAATKDRSDEVFEETIFTVRGCDLNTRDVESFAAKLGACADDDEALVFLEGFEYDAHELGHDRDEEPTRGRTAPAAHARKLAITLCDLDVDRIRQTTDPDFAKPTAELFRRAAARLTEAADLVEAR